MIAGKTKLAIVAAATLAAFGFSVSATAKLSANKLAAKKLVANKLVANRLAANAVADKAQFDLDALKVNKIILPDGTVLTSQ